VPEFRLPDLGEGLVDAEILTWLVSVGDEVQVDQPVIEVETAKASVQIPVPFSGRVSALHGAPGERIAVGSPLMSVETVSANVLVGYGPADGSPRRARRSSIKKSFASYEDARTAQPDTQPAVISPVVRKLARDRGLDLRQLSASDPSGVIRRADVERADVGRADVERADDGRPNDGSGIERIPLTGVRRLAADRFTQSRREIPEATVWVDVDATRLVQAHRDLDLSLLSLISRLCIAGLKRFTQLNSRVGSEAIELLPQVNLGFAAQTDKGLMVPVIPGADRLSTRQLAAALAERAAAARAGTLTPRDLSGGTFTVNNYGVYGVDGSAAIINYPEVAMLGIGRIFERPWVYEGSVAVRQVSQLTLVFDHRACDGAVAGGFLRYVADCVENPVMALADL